MEVDVLIVGAGPAGSTTARYCASKDLEVLMIDRRSEIGFPVQCGEYLPDVNEMHDIFPESLELEELFDIDSSLVSCHSDYIDMVSPRGHAYRCEFGGVTLDRRAFDKHLVKLAQEAGARIETKCALKSIREGTAHTSIGEINAKVIVGADGPTSRTARESGMLGPSHNYPAVTCQAEGRFEPVVKMYFGSIAPGGYGWIIPKRAGANVGVGFDREMLDARPSELFSRFVSMMGIRDVRDVTMGMVPASGPVETTVRGNTLLVGDAAGFTMATNGGGIPTAMIGGRAAGRAIRDHLRQGRALKEYEDRWRAAMYRPLARAVRTRRLADMVFPRDWLLGAGMAILGRNGLDRVIRCKRPFRIA